MMDHSGHIESIDLVTAMGRLLSSVELRTAFRQSPSELAASMNVAPRDLSAFISLDMHQLDQQADTLLNKRWHEVVNLIPRTIEELGDQARDLFMFYANQNWPDGHLRHPLDAFQFLQFLISNGIHRPCGLELQRVRRLQLNR